MTAGPGTLERRLGRILDVGSTLSTALLALALAAAVVPRLAAHSDRVADVGLVILLATPVVRVAAAALGFFAGREWLNVLMAAIVLAVLLASIGTAMGT